MRRICPIEMKFSGFVVLGKLVVLSIELFHLMHFVQLGIETYAGFSVSDLTGQIQIYQI